MSNKLGADHKQTTNKRMVQRTMGEIKAEVYDRQLKNQEKAEV